jgi:hypothetical protein
MNIVIGCNLFATDQGMPTENNKTTIAVTDHAAAEKYTWTFYDSETPAILIFHYYIFF